MTNVIIKFNHPNDNTSYPPHDYQYHPNDNATYPPYDTYYSMGREVGCPSPTAKRLPRLAVSLSTTYHSMGRKVGCPSPTAK